MSNAATIDLAYAALADTAGRAPAPTAHPRSLLELPRGEARESLLTVHGVLGMTLPPKADVRHGDYHVILRKR